MSVNRPITVESLINKTGVLGDVDSNANLLSGYIGAYTDENGAKYLIFNADDVKFDSAKDGRNFIKLTEDENGLKYFVVDIDKIKLKASADGTSIIELSENVIQINNKELIQFFAQNSEYGEIKLLSNNLISIGSRVQQDGEYYDSAYIKTTKEGVLELGAIKNIISNKGIKIKEPAGQYTRLYNYDGIWFNDENCSYILRFPFANGTIATQEWVNEQDFGDGGTANLPLKKGSADCSIEQTFIENGEKKGSNAYGKYSAALNQSNNAYQRNSFVTGGGNKVGLTEAEFNTKNPSGTDEWGSTYDKSNSFASAGGQECEVTGRGSHIGGGYKNKVSGNYSGINAGGNNKVSGNYSGINAGYGNEVQGDQSAVLDGKNIKITGNQSGGGGENIEVTTDNTHAFGANLKSNKRPDATMVGRYNNENSYALFQVGTGWYNPETGIIHRRNSFEVFENGVNQFNEPVKFVSDVDLSGANIIGLTKSTKVTLAQLRAMVCRDNIGMLVSIRCMNSAYRDLNRIFGTVFQIGISAISDSYEAEIQHRCVSNMSIENGSMSNTNINGSRITTYEYLLRISPTVLVFDEYMHTIDLSDGTVRTSTNILNTLFNDDNFEFYVYQ